MFVTVSISARMVSVRRAPKRWQSGKSNSLQFMECRTKESAGQRARPHCSAGNGSNTPPLRYVGAAAVAPTKSSKSVQALFMAQGSLKETSPTPTAVSCLWCGGPRRSQRRICRGAVQRGIFSFMAEKGVIRVRGKHVLGSERALLRVVLDAIPTTSYQAVLQVDSAPEFCPELPK